MIRYLSRIKRHLYRKDNENETAHGICPVCNTEVELYWEPRYNGVRGSCSKCGTNWAES